MKINNSPKFKLEFWTIFLQKNSTNQKTYGPNLNACFKVEKKQSSKIAVQQW